MLGLATVALALVAPAPPAFPVASHGHGDLRHVAGVPVLTVRGTPAEVGDQFGTLAVKNAPDVDGLLARFLKDSKQEKRYALAVALARTLRPNFPPHTATEMEAVAKAAGRTEDMFLFADTVADLSSGLGCATVVVDPARSSAGGPLLGRNFDWLPTRGLSEHTLVVVYKQAGKRAFAAVTVTPIAGVISGMNDAGLAVTVNEIHLKTAGDKSRFDWKGTPLLFAVRRVLEECTTVAEAETLLRATPRTTSVALTVCDKTGGAVFEMTPARVVVRRAVNGVTCCTNHFRTTELCTTTECKRYDVLCPLQTGDATLSAADVFARLDDVHQGAKTLQAMVFEPASRVLHLAYGEGPATKRPPVRLDLGAMFDGK